ncbi:hypothetical protein GC197_03735 [bacterium]|nr:hypothetical protein [bacterium]
MLSAWSRWLPVPRWSWFQVRISTLLLFIMLCSVFVAWMRDRAEMKEEILELQTRFHSIGKPSWGIAQVLGPPDTKGFGDIRTAWASRTPDEQEEWIIAYFDKEVKPEELRVHETYNPGALHKVSIFTQLGNEVTVWSGTDPTPQSSGGGVSKIAMETIWQTKKVKIYLDSKGVPGWNEIDAIGLVDTSGNVHWAKMAEASTSYSDYYPGSNVYPYQGVTTVDVPFCGMTQVGPVPPNKD